MSNFKGTPSGSVPGRSNYSTVDPMFRPTFWGNFTKGNMGGTTMKADMMPMKKMKMGRKMGKCPNCG